MAVFNLWKTSKSGDDFSDEYYRNLQIDLACFSCGETVLGEVPHRKDFFSLPLCDDPVFSSFQHGLTLELEGAVLDSIVVDLADFPGKISLTESHQLAMGAKPESIIELWGEPYWVDLDDDEMIFFYEIGEREVQFEFTREQGLVVISLLNTALMADESNRKAYGVDKEWPPK